MTEAVGYAAARGVATVTLDRPEQRNAMSADLLDGLGEALDAAMADTAVRVVVLTNNGPAFSAGADLKAGPNAPRPKRGLNDLLAMILDAPKPVVGRIAGHCMGGGVGLAAACDISVASTNVRFGFTEVRVGVAPAIISVVCLQKLRRADALELFLTGERISAERAAEVGLINRSVPEAELDAAVGDVVAKVLAGGPNALAASKDLVNRVPSLPRDDAFAWTAKRSGELFASEEAAAGMAAFRDRADPPWTTTD
jgi:methylglutaconyl-CoA hydratase